MYNNAISRIAESRFFTLFFPHRYRSRGILKPLDNAHTAVVFFFSSLLVWVYSVQFNLMPLPRDGSGWLKCCIWLMRCALHLHEGHFSCRLPASSQRIQEICFFFLLSKKKWSRPSFYLFILFALGSISIRSFDEKNLFDLFPPLIHIILKKKNFVLSGNEKKKKRGRDGKSLIENFLLISVRWDGRVMSGFFFYST